MTNVHGEADTWAFADVSVLQAAAELIAGIGERENAALERGIIRGYANGWRDGLLAGAERGTAA